MYKQHWDEAVGEHGPVYKAIERALWVFAPVPALLLFLSYPSMQAARQQLETELANEVAAENRQYCDKWGMPEGSDKYLECARDLAAIRLNTEQRLRDMTVTDLDF